MYVRFCNDIRIYYPHGCRSLIGHQNAKGRHLYEHEIYELRVKSVFYMIKRNEEHATLFKATTPGDDRALIEPNFTMPFCTKGFCTCFR